MGVERGNAAGWGSQGPPSFSSYSSPCPCLGQAILGPPGSVPTLLPQSPFSTQAATMAKTWQDGQEPTAGEYPLAGWGGHTRLRARSTSPTPDPWGATGQSDTEHRDPLSCQKPLQQIRKMEH